MPKGKTVPTTKVDCVVLLPCPFCGEEAVEDEEDVGNQTKYWICCSYCNATFYSFTSMKRAVMGWNNRKPQKCVHELVKEYNEHTTAEIGQ